MSTVYVILESTKSALDLALYLLLPVMVVMMALMKALEAGGILKRVAQLLEPPLRVFGLPGEAAFALLQALFVSFAAPKATLSMMERSYAPRKGIAATLAMVLTVSQANVVFPLAVVGLNLGITIATSLVGGFAAAALAYRICPAADQSGTVNSSGTEDQPQEPPNRAGITGQLLVGVEEGLRGTLKAVPWLIPAICLVNTLKAAGLVPLLEQRMSPFLNSIGLPGVAALPIVTKFVAGGTAMTGVVIKLLQEGAMTAAQLNRLAGFTLNPCDLVGIPLLLSAGPRVAAAFWPAAIGVLGGLAVRGLLHLLLF